MTETGLSVISLKALTAIVTVTVFSVKPLTAIIFYLHTVDI